MLKENWRFISRVERCGDILIIVLSFVAAYALREYLGHHEQLFGVPLPLQGPELAPLKDYFIVLVVGLVSFLSLLHFFGAYRSMRLSSTWYLVRTIGASSFLVAFILAAVLFTVKVDLSRAFVALFVGLSGIFIFVERIAALALLRYLRRQGFNFRNVIICGTGAQAVQLAAEIARRHELGIRVRAFANLAGGGAMALKTELQRAGIPYVGRVMEGVEGVGRGIKEYAIDEVIFTDVRDVMPQVEEVIGLCTDQGIRTTIVADLFSLGMLSSAMSYFGGLPLIHFQAPPGDRWELGVKRALDVIVAGCGLILLAPLFVLIALGIKLTSPGPVLYRQTRVGLNGRLFTMVKFRSMVDGAEAIREQLDSHNEMQGPVFKMREDPRVTPFGKWLRRFSLDELPQLWNVLRGDMSLVGPRPPVPHEVNHYERKNRRRLSMRPGITCTWQVSGRNDIVDFATWVKLDLEYIDNWSLGRDIALLVKTIPAVLTGKGAR